jgi:Sulfotransferase family
MNEPFRLLMISAMYENGGNTTQRLLDGHPELIAYPFESQLGTRLVQDHLSSLYPAKYRWPEFALEGTAGGDYEAIIDEECKVRIKTPQSSKFRDTKMELDNGERKAAFVSLMKGRPRSRQSLTEAFLRASAAAWRDRARSDREQVYVGYSPIVGVDADRILADHAGAHVLNVVRNPWSAYADTKKRAVPLSLAHYLLGWTVHLQHALTFADKFRGRVHTLRYEDLVVDPRGALRDVLGRIGVGDSPTLSKPSWNGQPLREVYPWGTIRIPTPEANQKTAAELSPEEHEEVRRRAGPLLAAVGYA